MMKSRQVIRTHLSRALALATLSSLLLVAQAPAQDTGSADFTRYVSIGDSLTAGFMSGGLVAEVQALSYPALISRQAQGSNQGFEQPTVSAPGIPPLLRLRNLAPLTITPSGTGLGSPTNLTLPRPYSNLAVPGANINDLINTVSDGGGLHDLILRGLGTQLQQAAVQQPTFVTVWIGNNDALGAATSGLVIEDVTLTSLSNFESKFRTAIATLQAVGAQLAMATIADVTAIPFVTAVPPVLVNPATNLPVLVNGQLVPLIGPDGPLTPGVDFLTLNAPGQLAQGRGIPLAFGGSGLALTDDVVLSGAEVATINDRINGFNSVIRTVAGEVGAAVVDMNVVFNRIARNGLSIGGVTLTTEFLTGGLFSYDGVHASATGYAVVANEFIKAINAQFGGAIPQVALAPFFFGPDGRVGTNVETGANLNAGFLFTRRGDNNLRFALGVPDRATLRRIKAEREGQISTGDGDGDSPGGDGGDSTPIDNRGFPVGHGHYCSDEFKCGFGLGDCDVDSHCEAGLRCIDNRGADFGFRPKVDICL